ncbi:sucrase ferredoxin [Streptomyces abyssomicinicus]|uniref:sucrase ferredoxin n=1 Tax=Streptomyces abyssomicinicus TaxID=574929 RepID=UPI0012506617|nr:sucrase ferredoxin [Streptomyces abyssomicinicus]
MSRCATVSRVLDEPIAGTAVHARTWLLLEQPGPWGPEALTSSRLDPALGRALEDAAAGSGVRVALIRRPGRHADHGSPPVRQVYAAHTAPGYGWVRSAVTSEPERLLDIDFAALGLGGAGAFDAALPAAVPYNGCPLAFVCTNGRRDRCCALLGRPLAAELAASGVTGTWEVTHLGGHRFSPTLLVLPHGYAYGRVDAPAVKEILHRAREGRVVTEHCRGRSAWPRPGQAAELAVRARTGATSADALDVIELRSLPAGGDAAPPLWEATVAHAGGRRWRVVVAQNSAGPPRPESCGAPLGSPLRMDVLRIEEEEEEATDGPAS